MNIQSTRVRPQLQQRALAPKAPSAPSSELPQDNFQSESSVAGSALKSALVGAAYGAVVGGATNALYSSTSLMTATAVHAGGILAGGGLGAAVIGKALLKKAEPAAAYPLGALAGTGVTWATSAFGMLANPMVGVVAGATLGAFFGAVGGAIHASNGTNDRLPNGLHLTQQQPPQSQEPPKSEEPGIPKAAWNGLSIAYAVGGGAITAAMVAKGIAGTLTPGLAIGGTLVAAGAFTNAYLLHKATGK